MYGAFENFSHPNLWSSYSQMTALTYNARVCFTAAMSLEAQMCFVKGVPLRVIDSKNVTCMRVWIWASFSITNFTNTYMHGQNEMLACLFAVCLLYQIFDVLSLSPSLSLSLSPTV